MDKKLKKKKLLKLGKSTKTGKTFQEKLKMGLGKSATEWTKQKPVTIICHFRRKDRFPPTVLSHCPIQTGCNFSCATTMRASTSTHTERFVYYLLTSLFATIFTRIRLRRTSFYSGARCQLQWHTSERGRLWAGVTKQLKSGAWNLVIWMVSLCTKKRSV